MDFLTQNTNNVSLAFNLTSWDQGFVSCKGPFNLPSEDPTVLDLLNSCLCNDELTKFAYNYVKGVGVQLTHVLHSRTEGEAQCLPAIYRNSSYGTWSLVKNRAIQTLGLESVPVFANDTFLFNYVEAKKEV